MRNFVRIFQPIVHARQLDSKQAVFSSLLRIRPVNPLSAKKPSAGTPFPADKPSPQKSAREADACAEPGALDGGTHIIFAFTHGPDG